MEQGEKKVLILYASYGDGHLQVSRALRDSLEQKGAAVRMVDLFAEAHPVLNALTKFLYLKSYTWFPRLYGWLYERTKRMDHRSFSSGLLNSFGLNRLRNIVEREQPDLVINTFPMPVMPASKRQGTVPATYTVMTDFALHRRWVHPAIGKFYVATPDLKKAVAELGIVPGRIAVSGIPINKSFRRLVELGSIYRKYGLSPDKPTLLMMAGSYGVLQGMSGICREVSLLAGVQLVIVCGNNNKLRGELQDAFCANADVHVLGFVKNMHELMAISSCLVTKPGGITLSEALSANLPVLLFRPVPGQERDNAAYLAAKGAALIVEDSAELLKQIRLILLGDGVLKRMRQAIGELRRPHAAEEAAADMLAGLNVGAGEIQWQQPHPGRKNVTQWTTPRKIGR